MTLLCDCSVSFDADTLTARLLPVCQRAENRLSERVLSDCEPYIPFDTGALCRSGAIRVSADAHPVLVWDAPYASPVYYGDLRGVRFRTEHHPLASPRWFSFAKAASLGAWLSMISDDLSEIGGVLE